MIHFIIEIILVNEAFTAMSQKICPFCERKVNMWHKGNPDWCFKGLGIQIIK